ncbi:MAG: 1-acyl-sn-glycerol-3-phosphate acyltransferase [Sphingobacteriaceae bacterium]|nr:1-acyl-sn-glycerol-3-phosphate acyltransferase [Sphingobacteriaceae bacterium]
MKDIILNNIVVRHIFTPIFGFFFFFFLIIFHPIQVFCYNVFGYSAHKKSVDILCVFLTYCHWITWCSVKYEQEEELPIDRPKIFISNHQSFYDIPAILWFLRKHHIKFISKIELTRGMPSTSYNLRVGGGANIDRNDGKQAISEIIKLGRRMKEKNWSTVIFAEGTRSRDGVLKPFQVGGISALLKSVPNALVVPIVIQNCWALNKDGAYPLRLGQKLSWSVLKPIDTEGKNAEEITKAAEMAIRAKLGQ